MNRHHEYDMYSDYLKKLISFTKRNKSHISYKNYQAYLNLADFIDQVDKSSRAKIKIDITKYEFLMHRSWCEKILKVK
ncbi:MAG: hypothetical protein RLZZ546_907 [Bacteroidota bacterium]|jgi:hypothetical protein